MILNYPLLSQLRNHSNHTWRLGIVLQGSQETALDKGLRRNNEIEARDKREILRDGRCASEIVPSGVSCPDGVGDGASDVEGEGDGHGVADQLVLLSAAESSA